MGQRPDVQKKALAPLPKGRRKRLGALGEALAVARLEAQGYSILARNWRYGRIGEIDIVALSPSHSSELPPDVSLDTSPDAPDHWRTLVFIEVKTRKSERYGHVLEALAPKQQARLLTLAEAYLAQHPQYAKMNSRIDMVCVTPLVETPGQRQAQYVHLPNVVNHC